MTESQEILSEIGLKPISIDHPAGINVRYDEDFEFVEDELSKQGSMIDRGQVNWDKVTEASINILSNKSKDLKVSCYLIRSLFENKGLSGLEAGLNANYQLLTNFWDDLFPIKKKARANAYEWLSSKFESSKFESLLDNIEPDLESLSYLENSYASIQNIEQFLNEKLSDDAPALGNFRRMIYELVEPAKELKNIDNKRESNLQTIQVSEKNINQTVVNSEHASGKNSKNDIDIGAIENQIPESAHSEHNNLNKTVASNLNAPIVLASEKDKNKIIRQCHETLRDLSSWSIDKTLDSPSAYAINRFSTWMGISQLPLHNNNVTPLKPIPKDKISLYTNLFNNKNFQSLIPQVELSFSKSPFWLDAHRLVSISLEALGMSDSSNQVKEHLGVFLRRFPALVDLKFSDQSDFADQLTKQWINSEILAKNSNQTTLAADTNDDSEYETITCEARDLVKQKKMKEAIKLFKKNILLQLDLRKKTFWKYYLARFCFDNGEQKLAFFLLKEIDGFLQKNNLQCWEPDLEKNVVYLLIQSLKNSSVLEILQGNPVNLTQTEGCFQADGSSSSKGFLTADETSKTHETKEMNKLYSRLCQLDPVLALDIK